MPKKRSTYHHGDLRKALIEAADGIIAEGGIEAFSLRAAAQRAGVSPGAPAHHFGSAKGLLTEVALLAFERLGLYLEEVGHSDDVVANVRALGLTFITFTLDHPGHFRLMFRNDLVNREDPRFSAMASKSGTRLGLAVAAYRGNSDVDLKRFEDAADMLCDMATLHGLAHLVLEEKAPHFFRKATSRQFVKKELPKVLERLYPDPLAPTKEGEFSRKAAKTQRLGGRTKNFTTETQRTQRQSLKQKETGEAKIQALPKPETAENTE